MGALDLSTLELGPLDADDDQNLAEYFISFGEFDALMSKSKLFVVGAKGSGKSAIRRFIFDRRDSQGRLVVSVEPPCVSSCSG
jgi:polynucleotide 5'-kinase involved in rRNA processing